MMTIIHTVHTWYISGTTTKQRNSKLHPTIHQLVQHYAKVIWTFIVFPVMITILLFKHLEHYSLKPTIYEAIQYAVAYVIQDVPYLLTSKDSSD